VVFRYALDLVNGVIIRVASVALVAAAAILSYSVVVRYFLKLPTYWEDEAAVFLLVGATFLSAANVQDRRGHIGIEAIAGLLPEHIDRARRMLVDLLTLLFCTFFAWKSWTLCHEAWADGQVTNSTWAPPMWIPYSAMAVGMSLLVLQIALQLAESSRK
jgi:TRAP-type C4-dicarboxylate transport system permease small subunit